MARRGSAVAGTSSSTRLGADKETEALAKKARKAGWTVEVTGGNHIRWTPPPLETPEKEWTDEEREGQAPVVSGLTAGSYALPKLKSQLRRKGLHI
ncbi:hypothetical protein [Streptomyces sp. NPDC002088]|uniref:hypothetical protein n=1 Tax=Streptomyces sp. NPDC002088 TaxID=3154665 RepID=UPI00331921ED